MYVAVLHATCRDVYAGKILLQIHTYKLINRKSCYSASNTPLRVTFNIFNVPFDIYTRGTPTLFYCIRKATTNKIRE